MLIYLGTHIFLYDLKQLRKEPGYNNSQSNYELFFDFEKKDIYFNFFKIQVGDGPFIDNSLKTYIKFLFLKVTNVTISIMNEKISIVNPLKSLQNFASNFSEVTKLTNLKLSDEAPKDCILIDGESYKGILFNKSFFQNYIKSSIVDSSFIEAELFNGVLLYQKNRLVARIDQKKLGDTYYFIKEIMNNKESLFNVSGFIELPEFFETLPNKSVFLINNRSLKINHYLLTSSVSYGTY